eukprot:TRINITY_DN6044_c0_g1_i1.p1 TRINITY_DN6044_c0_g1~~TRINITY_DN6044_c0_g1_i1.p1  ORF type:complete len:185 (+),score=33.43 TRINITY_DN6044_c0_g1_i1:169-723(+)
MAPVLVSYIEAIGNSGVSGSVWLWVGSESTVQVELTGLEPNSTHGIHIHQGWSLSGDGMECMGHFNPYHESHNCPYDIDASWDGPIQNTMRHVGDMGSFMANGEGVISQSKTIDLVDTVYITGRCIVVHAAFDDCTGASGNAGSRLAQGLIESACDPELENVMTVCGINEITYAAVSSDDFLYA